MMYTRRLGAATVITFIPLLTMFLFKSVAFDSRPSTGVDTRKLESPFTAVKMVLFIRRPNKRVSTRTLYFINCNKENRSQT